MTVIHIVLFRFISSTPATLKAQFLAEAKSLKSLSCIQDGRLIVGGPSITDPIERSKGFEFVLLSFHPDRAALAEYQSSKEHHKLTSEYVFPYKGDLVRFDFEVDGEDEYMCRAIGDGLVKKFLNRKEESEAIV